VQNCKQPNRQFVILISRWNYLYCSMYKYL